MPHLSKLSRYTLGAKIDALFVETIELIVTASYAAGQHKLPLLIKANGKLDILQWLLKLTWEMEVLNNQQYLAISQPLVEVGKQLGGWRKQLQ